MAVQFISQSGIKTPTRHKNMLGNNPLPPVQPMAFAVVAGGGFDGCCEDSQSRPGLGGAGGFRKSFQTELSGGGAPSEVGFQPLVNQNVIVTVGGAGSDSSLGSITSTRGGNGGNIQSGNQNGGSGGSGGGGRGGQSGGGGTSTGQGSGGAGIAGQGFNGGAGGPYQNIYGTVFKGGGGNGGGAGGSNGAGLATSIRGSSQTFAASTGGGVNTGNKASSGIVIVRYPTTQFITIGPGLTSSTTTIGSDNVTTFTAGTGNVSWTY